MRREGALRGNHRGYGRRDLRKRVEQSITLHIDLLAAVGLKGRAQHPQMLDE
jgi:hypothetical protein